MENFTPLQLWQYCQKNNIKIERIILESGILTLRKNFTMGSQSEYVNAESDTSIIYSVPVIKSQSSIWGTTGDTIGGYSAVLHGSMVINRSSCKKTFLKELIKIMESSNA